MVVVGPDLVGFLGWVGPWTTSLEWFGALAAACSLSIERYVGIDAL